MLKQKLVRRFVIRDHNGHATLAGSGSLRAVHDAECAEAQACLAALQAMQSSVRDLSPASVLYEEATELISLCFISVQLSRIPRSCNSSAYELARLSLSWDQDHPHIWLDPLPSFVFDILVRDFAEPHGNERTDSV